MRFRIECKNPIAILTHGFNSCTHWEEQEIVFLIPHVLVFFTTEAETLPLAKSSSNCHKKSSQISITFPNITQHRSGKGITRERASKVLEI
jgi:hypothetical protein